MIVDIFYKTYSNDYEFLIYSLYSVKKYLKGFRNIIIVTDHGELKNLEILLKKHNIDNVKIYELSKELNKKINFWDKQYKRLGINQKKTFFGKCFSKRINNKKPLAQRSCPVASLNSTDIHIGYEIQKAVKCDWNSWSDADAVLQLDSDIIFRKYLHKNDFFNGFKIHWIKSELDKERKNTKISADEKLSQETHWKPGTDWLFNTNTNHIFMWGSFFIITSKLCNDFKQFVMERTNYDIYDFFLSPELPNFSEYELLGQLAYLNKDRSNYAFTEIFNVSEIYNEKPKIVLMHDKEYVMKYWSWGGLNQSLKKEIFDAIQFEK